MANLDPAAIAAKQVSRSVAAQPEFVSGVNNPTRDWKQSTLKADAKRKAALEEAEKEGRWAKGVGRQTTADWQARTAGVGADRYAQGVQNSADKTANFWNIQVPKLKAVQAAVEAMPDTTPQQREQRMLENLRKMKTTGY